MGDLTLLAELLQRHREAGPLAALDLEAGALAVVAGAYQGETMAFLRQVYGPDLLLHGFEPQSWAAQAAAARFAEDSKATVHPFGLGVESGIFPMYETGTDAASFLPLPNARTAGQGELREACGALAALCVNRVGLLLLNMEGYEYALLQHLGSEGWLPRMDYLMVQFHQIEGQPYAATRQLIGRTHEALWDQGPSWVLWRRRRKGGAL